MYSESSGERNRMSPNSECLGVTVKLLCDGSVSTTDWQSKHHEGYKSSRSSSNRLGKKLQKILSSLIFWKGYPKRVIGP